MSCNHCVAPWRHAIHVRTLHSILLSTIVVIIERRTRHAVPGYGTYRRRHAAAASTFCDVAAQRFGRQIVFFVQRDGGEPGAF